MLKSIKPPGKLQKHDIFEQEMTSNYETVQYLHDIGDKMLENDHYASDNIKLVLRHDDT